MKIIQILLNLLKKTLKKMIEFIYLLNIMKNFIQKYFQTLLMQIEKVFFFFGLLITLLKIVLKFCKKFYQKKNIE